MQHIPIIYYHSVGKKHPTWPLNFLTLELPFFEDQIKFFSKKFQAIDFQEYYQIQNGKSTSAKHPLIITFDDGYLDNWQYAFPLLKKYGLKATIFVSPEFIDKRNIVRPNLEDVWQEKAEEQDLKQWGFLSWEEMRIMQSSGVIDIQSHTMSHTKYPVSAKLIGFYKGGAEGFYTICNQLPDKKPYYIEDDTFFKSIPHGYPLFEESSAVTARKVEINPEFIDYCENQLKDFNWQQYTFEEAFALIKDRYATLKNEDRLIVSAENETQYKNRVKQEIFKSKEIIEAELNKKVDFLCWPHGDNNQLAHKMAIDAGYKATTWGNLPASKNTPDRIPPRIGSGAMRNNRFLTLQRLKFKLKTHQKKFPQYHLYNLYLKIRY
ncbi:MAG: polysaccharide deacetylase family protein [Bacteroidales bacterium]